MTEQEAVHEKLVAVRAKQDIALPPNAFLRATVQGRDGSEVSLTLRNYQKQMVLHLLAMKRFVVGDDCGLGKTLESIAALTYIWAKNPTVKVFILTKKSSIYQWQSEINRFTQGVSVFIADGDPKVRHKAQTEWAAATTPAVLIQGYASAGNDFAKIQGYSGYVLITDEATAYNSLVEGYGIYRVVVPELFRMNPTAFEQQFCIVRMQQVARNRMVQVVVGYREADVRRFRDLIDPYYLGRPKHAVATELPVLVTRDVVVGLTPFQEAKYKETLEGLLEMGDGDQKNTDQLTSIIYCQEIVNHPGLIGFRDYDSEKLAALLDLVTDGELAGEKVIVFTRFSKMVNIGIEELEKAGVKCVRVTGAEDGMARKAAMESFQDVNSDTKVIWITMAGGDAINLQSAKALVFFDTPWSAGDYLQILGRMIRIGSTHDRVLAMHLVAKDTIDERVQDVRRKKMRLVESVLGQRIKGEADTNDEILDSNSEIKDLFDALRADARKMK